MSESTPDLTGGTKQQRKEDDDHLQPDAKPAEPLPEAPERDAS